MIIAVNTRLLLHDKLDGIGRFTNETLKIITGKHPEHKFIFIFDRKYSGEFVFSNNIIPVIAHPPARHPILWYIFFEWGVPPVLRKYKADLFLSPDGWLSLNTRVKSLPVVHDLNFFHMPEFLPWSVRKYYQYYFPKFIHKAHRIATVSEFSKQDIVSMFNYDKNRVDVVYNGANKEFIPLPDKTKLAIQEKYTHGCPFFLFIGLIHPRKNLTSLIKAFEDFKQSVNSNVKLLVVGSRKWWTDDMQQALDNSYFKEDIIFTGRVADNELRSITASAIALVYASHFEGFGIPVLEAMYCDTPVITSEISSLPEVGGDAVMYVNPSSVDSIKSAMLAMFCDSNMRRSYVEKGKLQREKFTWEKSADLLWKSVEECLKGN